MISDTYETPVRSVAPKIGMVSLGCPKDGECIRSMRP